MKTLMALLAVSLVLLVGMPAYAALDDRQAAEEVNLFFIDQDDALVAIQPVRDTAAEKAESDSPGAVSLTLRDDK